MRIEHPFDIYAKLYVPTHHFEFYVSFFFYVLGGGGGGWWGGRWVGGFGGGGGGGVFHWNLFLNGKVIISFERNKEQVLKRNSNQSGMVFMGKMLIII